MKIISTIFENLGFNYSMDRPFEKGTQIQLLYINNPDGSVRWIWPAQLQNPLFLKFYSISSFKARFISVIIKAIFLLRIQKLIFKNTCISLQAKNSLSPVILIKKNWALFTGTAGPNRKALLYTETPGNNTFIKIALNERSNALLQNEEKALERLSWAKIKSFTFPELLWKSKNILQLSDLSEGGKRHSEFFDIHLQALGELSEFFSLSLPIRELTSWKETKSDLENLLTQNNSRIPKGLLRKLSMLIDTIDDSISIENTICHGDFTPWNMYEKDGKLNIYDWELHQLLMPLGFDAFHFIIQSGILVERQPWTIIEAEIKEKINPEALAKLTVGNDHNVELYLKLYLIFNTVYYLNLFTQQDIWHVQVDWLLKTWNEAISSLLANSEKHRSLVLIDTFDFLLNKPYAALKFPNDFPEQLSEYSDVDLCLDHSNADLLSDYLKNHPLVLKSKVIKKSHMTVLKLVCKDGSLLSLDLIWNLKRKATVMMDIQSLIQSATLNDYQIKTPTSIDLARFIVLFYTLNNASVPSKYLQISKTLKESKKPVDQKLYQVVQNISDSALELKKLINRQKANSGFQKLKNQTLYLLDTVKEVIYNPGMIITFSGVDGAGKSTIIDKVKNNIEKQLRRRVVVIRHRPSVLPILSAWTKGKVTAEKEAADRLPRQGKNKSILSSFLRFCYYYTDYLFGQFVVYFKYVFRGYVVLYDRYYFDFINDSQRSNIQLPSSLTRLGYNFLIKPELNFFLYADPELILSRKKELDAKTIEQLTKKYQTLFEQLNKKDSNKSYVSIENTDLEITLNTIIRRVNHQAA